jgi:hypothetical protein
MPQKNIATDDPPRQVMAPQRPIALPVAVDNIPEDLTARRQWVTRLSSGAPGTRVGGT